MLVINRKSTLKTLPIPSTVWQDVLVDFVTTLPTVKGWSVMIVVVGHLMKFEHVGTLVSNYSAKNSSGFFGGEHSQVTRYSGLNSI